MVLNLVWIYFLILHSDLILSKDVIETDGIPIHWKRCHKIVNNSDHHKINTIQNKKPSNDILNYRVGVQRPAKFVPSDLLSYKIMQPTTNSTNSNVNSIFDISNKKIYVRSDTKMVHNDENMKVEKKNVIYDNKENDLNQHNKGVDQILQKCPIDKEIENISNEFKNIDTFEKPNHAKLDIVREKDKLVMLLPQKNDTSSKFLEKLCSNHSLIKFEELQEHEDVISHNKEQSKLERNNDILKSHDFTERKSVNTDKIENYEMSRDDQQNVQPKFLHATYNPRGWIRYFRPNQYYLSNNSTKHINKLFSKTKYSNPFYDTQGRFTRQLSYGADKRYRRPDIRYQIGL